MVKGLPNENLSEWSVKDYFDSFGEVVKVDFAYKFDHTLSYIVKIVEIK